MDLWNLVLLICFFFFYVEASRPAIEEDAQQEKTHMDSAAGRIGHPEHLLAFPEEVRERIKGIHSTPKLHYSSDSKKGIFVRNLEDKDIPALRYGIDEMKQNAKRAQVATKTAHDQLNHLELHIQQVGEGLDNLNRTTKWLDPLMRIKYMNLEPDRMGAFNLPYDAEYWADVAAHVPQDDVSLNISGMASAHPFQVISTAHHQGACKKEAEQCQQSPDNCCDDLKCQEFQGLFMACEKAPVASAMTEVAALIKDKSSALLQRQTDVSPSDVDRRLEVVEQSTQRDLEDEISTQKDVELLKASIDAERRPGTRRGGEQRQSGMLSSDRDSGELVGARQDSNMSIDQPRRRKIVYSVHDRRLLSGIDQPRRRNITYSERDKELVSGARRDSNMSMRVEQSQRGRPSSDHDRGVVLSAPSTGRSPLAQPVVELSAPSLSAERFQEQRGGSRMPSAELSSGSNPDESSQLLRPDVTSQDAMTGGLRAEDLVKLKELEEENDIGALTDLTDRRKLGELRELYRQFTGLEADELVTLNRLEEEKEIGAFNPSMPEQRRLDSITQKYRAGLDQLIAQESRNLNRSLSETSASNSSSSVNMLGTSGRLSVAPNTEPLSLSGLSGLPERQTATTGIMLSGAGQLSDADQRALGLEAGRNAALERTSPERETAHSSTMLSEADHQALDLEAMRNAALVRTASEAVQIGIPLSKEEREAMSHELALEAKQTAVLEARVPKREAAPTDIMFPVVDQRELDLEAGRNPDLERTSLQLEEPQSGTMLSGAEMDLETRRKTSRDALSDAQQHVLELKARRNSALGGTSSGSLPLRPWSRSESLESLDTSGEREQPVSRFEEFRKTRDGEDLRRDAAELHQDELEEGMRTLDPLDYFNNTHKATHGWDAVGLDNRDRANYTGDEVRAFHEKISDYHDEVNELAHTLDRLQSMWRPAAQAGFNQILKDEGQRTDAFKEVKEVEPQGEYDRYEARGKQIKVRVKTNLGGLTP